MVINLCLKGDKINIGKVIIQFSQLTLSFLMYNLTLEPDLFFKNQFFPTISHKENIGSNSINSL